MAGASPWLGRVLGGKWRVDARLARGGVGTVYAATHVKNGNRVAIKILHPEFGRDKDTRSRFLQEGYAANKVNHPGVVRILDDDITDEGGAILVMELLEGELVEQRRQRKGGRLPLAEVYEIADQLLDVLAAAHEKKIVHRDIKPENLFLTKAGRLKVLDFGFAQMKSSKKEQTATGFLLGTPGFMSPEQAVGDRAIGAHTDIWAVGATLFRLLSGEAVHAGQSAAELLVAAANMPARSLATVTAGIPPPLVTIIDRALSFAHQNRWPSARMMQAALRSVPGRRTPSGDFAARRSAPDNIPDVASKPSEVESTIHDGVTELDQNDLEEASPGSARLGPTLVLGSPMSRPPITLAQPGRPSHPAGPNQTMLMPPLRPPTPTRPPTRPPEEAMLFLAGPARPPPPSTQGRRIWVVLAIAAISMVIVVGTGLLVLAGID